VRRLGAFFSAALTKTFVSTTSPIRSEAVALRFSLMMVDTSSLQPSAATIARKFTRFVQPIVRFIGLDRYRHP